MSTFVTIFGKTAGSLPYFFLAWLFLRTWIHPLHKSERMVRYLMYVMVLEFFIVHSTFFFGSIALGHMSMMGKSLSLIGIGLFYSVFAGGISLAHKSWWPFLSFWGLTLTKLYSYLYTPVMAGEAVAIKSSWAFMLVAYLVGCFLTLFLPVPRLGITQEVVERQQFKATGTWAEYPHKAIAFGFIYFAALGIFELIWF